MAAPPGTVGSRIPAGRYAIDLNIERDGPTFDAWIVSQKGNARLTGSQSAPPMTDYRFALARPAQWPATLAWPTLIPPGTDAPNVTPTSDPDYPEPEGSDLAHSLESALSHPKTILTVVGLAFGAWVIVKLTER